MKRMLIYALVGGFVGFVIFWILFALATREQGNEHSLWIVFSVMAAVPVAALAALFSAVHILQDELRETRRALAHWQSDLPRPARAPVESEK